MKKLNKVAMMFAVAALATAAGAQTRVTAANGGPVIDNWQNGTGELVWKNGTNELCWRDANWTPATAAAGCDGALVPAAPAAAARCSGARAAPHRLAPAVAASKVTFAADAFFDFDKSVLKPEGRAKLDDLVAQDPGREPRSDHRRRPHRLDRHRCLQPDVCRFAALKPSRPTWSRRASNAIASTPKARARSSLLPTTRPPKAAPRTVAWKSKWSVPAPTVDSARISKKTPLRRGFFMVDRTAARRLVSGVGNSRRFIIAHDRYRECRSGRTGQILRTRPPLVGSGKRIPAAARNQSAAPGVDRRHCADCRQAGCWTSAAAAASWPTRWRARAPRCWASTWPTRRSRWRSCTRWRPARRGVKYREVSAEALAAEQPASFDVVTCMEMLEHVPAARHPS